MATDVEWTPPRNCFTLVSQISTLPQGEGVGIGFGQRGYACWDLSH
jgi:hypothetical protein